MDFYRNYVQLVLLFCIAVAFTLVPVTGAIKKLPSIHHSKVLVLGAGMSGISAAKTLHENGIQDFTILEGFSRIGGRMRKAEFAGNIIELGANWVQGLKNNPIWALAQKHGLQGSKTIANPVPGYYIVRNENGQDVTFEDNLDGIARAIDKLDEIVQERRKAKKGDLDVQTGLRLAGWQAQNSAQSSVEFFYYDFDAGVRPHYESLRVESFTNGSIDSASGEQFFVFDERGYAVIVEEMANTFLEPEDPKTLIILFGKILTLIWAILMEG